MIHLISSPSSHYYTQINLRSELVYMCYPLCETCVELSYLSHIEPADFLLHDAVEEQAADAFDLTPCRQGPKSHLHVSCHQHHKAQDRIVDSISEGGKKPCDIIISLAAS